MLFQNFSLLWSATEEAVYLLNSSTVTVSLQESVCGYYSWRKYILNYAQAELLVHICTPQPY